MNRKGRFIFDERPSKTKELTRLIMLNEFYQSFTKGILLNIKNSLTRKIKKIIDIGAGTGHTTMLLKTVFPKAHVTYFDISALLYKYAENNFSEIDEYILGDIFNYNFSERYDLVFSRFALKHFFSPEKAVKIMTNILNHRGIICLIDKDVSSNIWFPQFPLFKTKFMEALNKYNTLPQRGGDSFVGRKIRSFLFKNGIKIQTEKLLYFDLTKESNIKFRNLYVTVYENLIQELVEKKFITFDDAMNDIEKLKIFLTNSSNLAMIFDYIYWGLKK